MVCMFSEYCEAPFTVEPVDVVNADGSVVTYPVCILCDAVMLLALFDAFDAGSERAT